VHRNWRFCRDSRAHCISNTTWKKIQNHDDRYFIANDQIKEVSSKSSTHYLNDTIRFDASSKRRTNKVWTSSFSMRNLWNVESYCIV
jgi:hypothetical protein